MGDPSPKSRRALTVVAHLAYGVGIGPALGLLRQEWGRVAEDTAVGTAVGTAVSSGLGSELDHLAAFYRGSPAAVERTILEGVLPILDHAVYGAAWGGLCRALRSNPV